MIGPSKKGNLGSGWMAQISRSWVWESYLFVHASKIVWCGDWWPLSVPQLLRWTGFL